MGSHAGHERKEEYLPQDTSRHGLEQNLSLIELASIEFIQQKALFDECTRSLCASWNLDCRATNCSGDFGSNRFSEKEILSCLKFAVPFSTFPEKDFPQRE